LHKVRSYEKVIPEEYTGVLEPAVKEDKKKNRQAKSEVNGSIRNWQVVISDLPCNCVHCIGICLSTLDAEIDERVIKVKVTQESDLEKMELCKYSKWRNNRIYKMKGPVQLEPKSPSSFC
jgi:hypothetical protein